MRTRWKNEASRSLRPLSSARADKIPSGRRLFPHLVLSLSLSLFLIPLVGIAGPTEGTKDAEALIEGLQKRYDSTSDFVSDFSQETVVKTLNRRLQASGIVYFKKPGKMLWKYEDPKGQLVLADGTFLYFYQPEQKQVLKTRLSKAFLSDTPLSFLLGIGELKRDFKGILTGSEGEAYVIRLVPKVGLGEIGRLFLGVDKKESDILWARIEDAVGNITTIRLYKMQRDVGINDSLFLLQVPKDVDIVELGGP